MDSPPPTGVSKLWHYAKKENKAPSTPPPPKRKGSLLCTRTFSNFVKLPALVTCKKESLILSKAQSIRNTSFFNKLSQEQLWKGVLSVSNAGKRKGRGRAIANTKRLKDPSLMFIPGNGKIRIGWPGLNTGVLKENEAAKIEKLPIVKQEQNAAPVVVRGRMLRKTHPLDRGWTGRKKIGIKLGPPNPVDDVTFEGFESIVLKVVPRQIMTSKLGRKKRFSIIVATGNQNGLIGFGKSYKQEQKAGLLLARARAAKRLIAIDLIEKHTVNHDFFSRYGSTNLFVFKKPKGYGLRCHRVLAAICKLIGIENLCVKVEGPCNIIHMIRAFIIGLKKQKTYEEMANEKKMHLVEYKMETFYRPKVLASPSECLTSKELGGEPALFEEYVMDGRLIYRGEPKVPFYQRLPSWEKHLKRTLYHRNHKKVSIELMAKYGSCRSHLADIYPECTGNYSKVEKNIESE